MLCLLKLCRNPSGSIFRFVVPRGRYGSCPLKFLRLALLSRFPSLALFKAAYSLPIPLHIFVFLLCWHLFRISYSSSPPASRNKAFGQSACILVLLCISMSHLSLSLSCYAFYLAASLPAIFYVVYIF